MIMSRLSSIKAQEVTCRISQDFGQQQKGTVLGIHFEQMSDEISVALFIICRLNDAYWRAIFCRETLLDLSLSGPPTPSLRDLAFTPYFLGFLT